MKNLISILAISALMFTAPSMGVFAYQGDNICTNKVDNHMKIVRCSMLIKKHLMN